MRTALLVCLLTACGGSSDGMLCGPGTAVDGMECVAIGTDAGNGNDARATIPVVDSGRSDAHAYQVGNQDTGTVPTDAGIYPHDTGTVVHDAQTTGCNDADGDGFGTGPTCRGPDCNDNDPTINPGHALMCDFLDHNCDGQPDSLDIDGDGYRTGTACTPADCNDHDATVHPGAPEVCDGIDQNCDSNADAYLSSDLDAYCVSTAPDLGPSIQWQYPPRCTPARTAVTNYLYLSTKSSCQGIYQISYVYPVTYACWTDHNSYGDCAYRQSIGL